MLKNNRSFCLGFCLCLALSIAFLQVPTPSCAFEIDIQVSPSTLNIQSDGQVVTVHTSIAYSSVVDADQQEASAVTLNEIPISWWKADNQGNFVAKFLMSEVKALVDTGELECPGENTLTLTGITTDGAPFTGTETITVIDIVPSGSGGK